MKKLLAFTMAVIVLFSASPFALASEATPEEQLAELQEKYDQLQADYQALLNRMIQMFGQDAAEKVPMALSQIALPAEEDEPAETSTPAVFDEAEVISQLEVRKLRLYDTVEIIIVKNNSAFDLDELTVDMYFYDANDMIVGVDDDFARAVGAGDSVVFVYNIFDLDGYERAEYEFSVEEKEYLEPVVSDLSYEDNVTDNRVILQVTNNGERPAELVEATVLFYRGENLVGWGQDFFTDDDFEIKPGDTLTEDFECYDSFDSYEVYFTGQRDR